MSCSKRCSASVCGNLRILCGLVRIDEGSGVVAATPLLRAPGMATASELLEAEDELGAAIAGKVRLNLRLITYV